MKFTISYKVEGHGWAIVCLSDGDATIEMAVSYLHDSLLDLAKMALSIKSGNSDSKTVFLDEPGELQLVVHIENGLAHYEARWFEDWAGWRMHSESDYKVVLKNTTTPNRIVQQITQVLWDIQQNLGPQKYESLWGSEFPIQQFKELVNKKH